MTLLGRTTESSRQRSRRALHTERLVLRAPRFEDATTIAVLLNDRRIAENLFRVPHPYGLADAEKFVADATAAENTSVFLITAHGKTVLGACRIIGGLEGKPPEIAYWLGVAHWGQGYATEAARALVDHAFGDLGHDALVAGVRVSNPSSRRVLEKCGFEWIGVGLHRILALASSAPIDRFRLDRERWAMACEARRNRPLTA
jgi:RimJ/RimL family protein N-acetyltransferase